MQSKAFSGNQSGKMFWESSLHSLKGYHNKDDILSVDSGKSFKFQSDLARPSHFRRTNQMETEVSSFNAESQVDAPEEKLDKSTTEGQMEEETKTMSMEDYFAKDTEGETSTKQNEGEEAPVQKAKETKEGTCQTNILED